MKKKRLGLRFDWQEWRSEASDLEELGRRRGARILFDIFLIRAFENTLLELKAEDCVWGPVHSSVGQEAAAASVMAALERGDKIAGSHRAHHQFLSKALRHVLGDDWNPIADDMPAEGDEVVRRTLAEIMGLAGGFCAGRGGSMHLRWLDAGILGTNAIVGGGIPMATGAAFAEKRKDSGNIVVCFFGDGAVNQGSFHEAANLAGLWKLPIIYFIENNLYAVATRTNDASAVEDLSARAAAYGMRGRIVRGEDAAGIFGVVSEAAEALRGGDTPWMVEARCYRSYHHAGDLPGSVYGYREEREEASWRRRDAFRTLPGRLVRSGLLDKGEIDRLREAAAGCVRKAVQACTTVGSGPGRSVRPGLRPDPKTAVLGLRSAEPSGITFREREDFGRFTEMIFSDAVSAVTGRWMERDRDVFELGEEVASFGGGAYGATKGLAERFPDRLLNTPISEAGFVGVALGAALSGLRPIVEIMFPDFSLVAADQLFNQVAKARHMYGGTTEVPLVARTRIASGCGYGAQHSMDPVGLFALFPGWRIVAPGNAFDYVGLFNSAMAIGDPVLILEHHAVYRERFPVPADTLDYFIPFGKARIVRPGEDISVITYGPMAGRMERLCEELARRDVSPEIIDLRTVDYPGIDYRTISDSIEKTGFAVVVEEAARSQSIGARIVSEITRRCFDSLDGPPGHLASRDVPAPVSRVLETAVLISDEEIVESVAAARRAD